MRRKYWLPLLGGLILVVALLACGSGGAPSGREDEARTGRQVDVVGKDGGSSGAGTTVNVVAKDMRFELRPQGGSQVSAGTITFVFTNDDPMPHDFSLSGNGVEYKTAILDPGESERLTVDLTPGPYTYICTVTGHALAGMKGTFRVT